MVEKLGEMYAGEIKADMLARIPYDFLALDATFEGVAISMNGNKAEALLVGAYKDIIGHIETKTESFRSYIPALMRLATRLRRIKVRDRNGTIVPAMKLLVALYRDRYCEGLADPSRHPCALIFDMVMRAPYADGYHSANAVIRTFNPGANQRQEYCAWLSRILRDYYQPVDELNRPLPCIGSLQAVANYLKKRPSHRGPQLNDIEAATKAKSTDFSMHAMRVGRSASVLVAELDELISSGEQLTREQHDSGETPTLFRPAALGGERATRATLDNPRSCCEKGCCTDPYDDPTQMHHVYDVSPESQLAISTYLGGTFYSEVLHKNAINRVLKFISRMTGEHRDMKIRWSIFFTNHRLDIKLGRITSRLVHLPPFVKIRLRQLFRQTPSLLRAPFPGDIEVPAITPDIDEPMGNKYVEDDSEMMADFEALVETSASEIVETTRDQPSTSPVVEGCHQLWFTGLQIYVFSESRAQQAVNKLLQSATSVVDGDQE